MFHRRLLGEEVMVVRDRAGVAHAMRDRCPHRFVPLHAGTREGDVIECPYHGLRFGLDGRCVLNPHGDGRIPPNARVRSFPLVERNMLLWIWMGDAERADPAAVPELAGHEPGRYAINKGYMHTPANYEYMTDNIMDLGHIEFLHKGLLGSEAVRRADVEVHQEGSTVYSRRLTHGEILPPALDAVYESEGLPVDRWLDVTWTAPANMQLVVGVTPAGQPARVGRETPGAPLLTPEPEPPPHDFWSKARDFRLEDHTLHQGLDEGLRYAFEHQDKPMILAQHEALDGEDFWDLKPVILAGDSGAVHARRLLQRLIREEQASQAGAN